MLSLGFPVIGVDDVPRATTFWTSALNLVATPEWESDTWRTLNHPDGSRIHLDLLVDTTAEQEAEVERLIGLGASKVDWSRYPPNPEFVVLADPDGNRFCVVDLSRAPSGQVPPNG